VRRLTAGVVGRFIRLLACAVARDGHRTRRTSETQRAGSMLAAKLAAPVARRHRWLSLALQRPRCLHGTSSAASQRARGHRAEDVVAGGSG
jgi:hypothetical protein